jgi:hypothetical protein
MHLYLQPQMNLFKHFHGFKIVIEWNKKYFLKLHLDHSINILRLKIKKTSLRVIKKTVFGVYFRSSFNFDFNFQL